MAALPAMLAWVWALSAHATTGALQGAPHIALYVLCTLVVATVVVAGFSASGVAAGALLVASCVWDVIRHLAPSSHQELLLTPPHALLAGATAVALLHWQARSANASTGSATASGIVSDALLVLWFALMGNELIGRPNLWHGSEFYVVTALVFPALLVVAGRRIRLGATCASVLYLVFLSGGYGLATLTWPIWSGSGENARAVLVHFPILLVGPALTIDALIYAASRRLESAKVPILALAVGPSFVLTMLILHWPMADLILERMNTPLIARLWPADLASAPWTGEYWTLDASTRGFAVGLMIATLCATMSAALGGAYSDFLQQPDLSKGTSR